MKRALWCIVLLLMFSLFSYRLAQYKPTPEPVPPLPEKYPTISKGIRPIATVQRQNYPLFLFTIFFPELLYVKEAQLPLKDAIEFWDRVAEADACGGTRLFIGHTSWKPKYEPWIEKPFLQDNNGKYILPNLDEPIGDYINPEWERLLLTRLKILRDREIFRSIDLWDFCQLHYRQGASWDTHWLKQVCSRKDIFDIHSQGFKYVEKFTRYVVRLIWEHESKFKRPGWNTSLGFSPGNEVPPIKEWNDRILEIVDEEIEKITPGIRMYRWQKLSSALPWQDVPSNLIEKNLYQFHQINSVDTYLDWKNKISINRFMISLDGARNKDGKYFLISEAEALELFNWIMADAQFGLELRVGHGKGNGRLPSEENGWRYDLSVIDLTVPISVVEEYKKFLGLHN